MNTRILMKGLSPIIFFISVGCASTPVQTQKSLMDSGAEPVIDAPLSLIGDSGVTYVESNGNWVNYLGADGRKVVKTKDGLVKELRWREGENGEFCQEMFSTGEEVCKGEDLVFLKDADGFYYIIDAGELQDYKFKLEVGNTNNL